MRMGKTLESEDGHRGQGMVLGMNLEFLRNREGASEGEGSQKIKGFVTVAYGAFVRVTHPGPSSPLW